jgi:hypothetical protein
MYMTDDAFDEQVNNSASLTWADAAAGFAPEPVEICYFQSARICTMQPFVKKHKHVIVKDANT